MKKFIKFISILFLTIFILLSLIIFSSSNIIAFKYLLILVLAIIILWALYKRRYKHSKLLQNTIWALISIALLYTSLNLYIMKRGIYLNGEEALWINGNIVEPKDKEAFFLLINGLKKYHAHIDKEPTYSITFATHGIFDSTKHLLIFRDKKLIYQNYFLCLKNKLDLDGYQLTKEADKKLEEFNKKYH